MQGILLVLREIYAHTVAHNPQDGIDVFGRLHRVRTESQLRNTRQPADFQGYIAR